MFDLVVIPRSEQFVSHSCKGYVPVLIVLHSVWALSAPPPECSLLGPLSSIFLLFGELGRKPHKKFTEAQTWAGW